MKKCDYLRYTDPTCENAAVKIGVEVDRNLVSLINDRESYVERYRKLKSEINDMKTEMDVVEMNLTSNRMLINAAMEKLLDSHAFVFSHDRFTCDFIRASFFCLKEGRGNRYNYVNVTGNQILATNGYMCVIIDCPCIPEHIKNAKILWSKRDFNIQADRGIEYAGIDYPDINGAIPSLDEYQALPGVCRDTFLGKCRYVRKGNIATINVAGIKSSYNISYLKTCVFIMGRDPFTVYVKGVHDLLIFKSSNTMTLLAPLIIPGENQ